MTNPSKNWQVCQSKLKSTLNQTGNDASKLLERKVVILSVIHRVASPMTVVINYFLFFLRTSVFKMISIEQIIIELMKINPTNITLLFDGVESKSLEFRNRRKIVRFLKMSYGRNLAK